MSFSVSHRSRSQFADMPGCSGGGRETIPAGRGKNMQREGEGEGGMLMNLIRANWSFSFQTPFIFHYNNVKNYQ